MRKKPVVLCILDGWGDEKNPSYNAPKLAHTPVFDRLLSTYPSSRLQACGLAVGLPEGQMGNSEVGHTNIGAGRIVLQTLPRIDQSCKTLAFTRTPTYIEYIARLKTSGGTAHIVGIVSDGGVHGHQSHVVTYANAVLQQGIPVYLHVFTDGRDTPPTAAQTYIDYVQQNTAAPIVTLTGRYWAMDRDNNWDRIQTACDAIACAQSEKTYVSATDAISDAHNNAITDEFIPACVIGNYSGFKHGDAVLCSNFRADRARQLLTALCDTTFDIFPQHTAQMLQPMGMVHYSQQHSRYMSVLYPPQPLKNTLGEVVANAGKTQIRTAETEKYPHVTFFFNGGRESPFVGEHRLLTPSPKVATYDLQPQMSAYPLTETLINRLQQGDIDMVIVNYANPDMVGHTGNLQAAIQACEAVDTCVGKLWQTVQELGGCLVVTADHGNCDIMYDTDKNQPHTAHTLNPVHFIICGAGDIKVNDGVLGDIAPTILQLMGIAQPVEMTATSLIQ